jgi:hypothetical protein
MSTLNSAINLYNTDQSGSPSYSLGSSSVVYVSLPDPNATSTAGSNCSSLGLPTLPSGYIYHCVGPSYYRNINGSGWIPINLQNISAGTPIGNLPVDPTNSSSSRLYYTYTTNGSQFEVTTAMESQKYQVGGSNDQISTDGGPLASVYEKGSQLGLEPLDYGDNTLVGYWPLNEGTGTIAYDDSGNNDTGTWHGTASGTSGYYSPGIVGPWAGTFNGVNDYAAINNLTNLSGSQITITLWFKGSFADSAVRQQNAGYITVDHSGQDILSNDGGTAGLSDGGVDDGIWHFMAMTWNQNTTNGFCTYKDGTLVAKRNSSNVAIPNEASPVYVGSMSGAAEFTNGLVDDVRIYDRALSAAEIQEIYNAEN